MFKIINPLEGCFDLTYLYAKKKLLFYRKFKILNLRPGFPKYVITNLIL